MAVPFLACKGCGAQFVRSKKAGQIPKYCSVKCRDRHRRVRNPEHRIAIERRANAKRKAKSDFAVTKRAYTTARLRSAYYASDPARSCDICGVSFCNLFGRQSAVKTCSNPCSAEKARRNKIRKEKARRIRKRGLRHEMVDLFKVLNRDGWRCQMCGIPTPPEHRGTYRDNAPEVDHIIPLAQGGEHSYQNTQCACRKCNRSKSDKVYGQLNLFAA